MEKSSLRLIETFRDNERDVILSYASVKTVHNKCCRKINAIKTCYGSEKCIQPVHKTLWVIKILSNL